MKRGNGWLKGAAGALIGVTASVGIYLATRAERTVEKAEMRGAAGATMAATLREHERRITEYEQWTTGAYKDYMEQSRKTAERITALEVQVNALNEHLAILPANLRKISDKQSEILRRLEER